MENLERNIRINKVLRELNISLERAVDFLKDKGVKIESNPNFKINQKEYEILAYQFAFKERMEVFTRNTNASLIVNNSDPSITPKVSILKHKPKEIKNDKRLKGSKVIRISDNKEYQSISQCMRENGFCSQKMHNLLKEEKFYKKVKI